MIPPMTWFLSLSLRDHPQAPNDSPLSLPHAALLGFPIAGLNTSYSYTTPSKERK